MTEAASDGQVQWHEAVAAKLAELVQIRTLHDDVGRVSYRNVADFAFDVADHYWRGEHPEREVLMTFWADVADSALARADEQERIVADVARREVAYLERLFTL